MIRKYGKSEASSQRTRSGEISSGMTLRQVLPFVRRSAWRRVGSGTFITSTRQEKIRGTTVLQKYEIARQEPSSQVISYRKTILVSKWTNWASIGQKPSSDGADSCWWDPCCLWSGLYSREFIKFQSRRLPTISSKPRRHGYKLEESHRPSMRDWPRIRLRYLQISKGQAILGLTQVSYFEDGTAFEYVKVSMSASSSILFRK